MIKLITSENRFIGESEGEDRGRRLSESQAPFCELNADALLFLV